MLQIETLFLQITKRSIFIKLVTSKGIKIQNAVLTKQAVKANGIKSVSAIGGIIWVHFYDIPYIFIII